MSARLSDIVYDGIRGDIESGRVKSKTFISENEIAEQYDVSKAPVKTALRQLCQEGFLIGYPRKGYMVNTMTDEEYTQLKIVRAHYEQLSVMLAITCASDEEIKSLRNPAEVKNPQLIHNAPFHLRLAEITHNPYHLDAVTKLIRFQVPVHVTTQSVNDSHERIIEALLARDTQSALERLHEDLFMDLKS